MSKLVLGPTMPTVAIEQSTFERLQNHAEPFVDTPDSVIVRALDALERGERTPTGEVPPPPPPPRGGLPKHPSATSGDLVSIGPNDSLPDLKHTRVLNAMVGGRPVAANWNNVFRHLLGIAVSEGHSVDEIRRLCAANLVAGEKEDEGYRHLAEAGISYQGLNANAAAAAAVALAKRIGVALELDFEWRQKQQALHPGRRARLRLFDCRVGA